MSPKDEPKDEEELHEPDAEGAEGAEAEDEDAADDDLAAEGEDADGEEEEVPIAADAHAEVKRFLEALIEKGVLVLAEGARSDQLVPVVLKALARRDQKRGASFLDALIDHDAVDEVFLDEDQAGKLLSAWF